MKINYNVQGKQRRGLADTIAKALGAEAVYQNAPTYAYTIGDFTVTREGEVEFAVVSIDKGELKAVVDALNAAGFEQIDVDGLSVKTTEVPPQAEDGETAPQSPETEEGGNSPDLAPQAPQSGDSGEPSESPYGETHLSVDTENTLTISFPRASLTLNAVENLHKMVASKAPLLRKALGTELLPISDDGEELKFAWFKMGTPHEEIMAYSQFITQLCKTAQAKQRVTATAPESFENEKFSMRVWLISLDMKGAEYALIRKLMMQNLDGNSGFRYEDKQPRNPRGGERVQKEVVSVRFTPEMLEKLAEVAGQSNMSRNQVIESVVCEYVQNMEYLQAVREHQAGNSESEGAVETAPAPDTEVLEMTEREELGLGQECRDPIGEDGMQATDCDDGEDPAESPETAAPAESTEGDGDSPAEQETAETGEAEGE